MQTFLALYHGASFKQSQIITVCVDPDVIALVAGKLLEQQAGKELLDPVLRALEQGKQAALRQLVTESHGK